MSKGRLLVSVGAGGSPKARGRPGASLIFLVVLTLALFVVTSDPESAAQAAATIYYVDAEGGDDSNGGTSEASPWATIDKANALDLEPGDQLLFKGGESFTGNLLLDAKDAGTAENPVVVGSYSGLQ